MRRRFSLKWKGNGSPLENVLQPCKGSKLKKEMEPTMRGRTVISFRAFFFCLYAGQRLKRKERESFDLREGGVEEEEVKGFFPFCL